MRKIIGYILIVCSVIAMFYMVNKFPLFPYTTPQAIFDIIGPLALTLGIVLVKYKE